MEALEPQTPTETPASPAPALDAPSAGFHEMNREERREFLRDGKAPTREKVEPVSDDAADSSTAPAEGQNAAEIAAKDKAPASETGKPAKDKKARNSEENRVQEMLEDRKRSDRRIQELEHRLSALDRSKTDVTKDSSTESKPEESKHKKYLADPTFPDINKFEDPNEWAAAVAEFSQRQIEAGLTAKETQSAEQKQHQAVLDQAYQRGASELEADPTVMDRIDPGLEGLKASRHLPADQRNVNTDIKDFVLYDTEKPLGLMAFYSTPDGRAEWEKMRTMDGARIQRTIIARELQLGSTVATGEAAKGEKKPLAKSFTKAPAPVEKEGPKGATASDGADSAVKSGDFAAFTAEMDARDPGSSRRLGRRR